MAENWTIDYERDMADYEASAELADYIPGQVIECTNCGAFVEDGTICENCGVPTESWIVANPDDEEYGRGEDCPLDGDAESALASCGWGTDEDYGYFGGDEW